MQDDERTQNKYEARRAEKETERIAKERGAKTRRIARWGIFAVAIAAVVLGLIWIIQQAPEQSVSRLVKPGTTIEHTKGPSGASAQLVEYSDFQCPACRAFYPLVKELAKEFPNDLEIAYRQFSLER